MRNIALLSILILLCGCTVETPYPPVPPSPMVTELPSINWPFTSTLPITQKAYPEGMTIYDCNGAITNTHWLTETFGAVSWTTWPTATAKLSELRACCGACPASIVTHSWPGATVMFYWSDAPVLPEALRGCGLDRGVWGTANEEGVVGFGMGGGSYYWPDKGEVGPHTLWTINGECISGIGMIAGTNHDHIDITWAGGEIGGDWGYAPGTLVYDNNIVVWPDLGMEQ